MTCASSTRADAGSTVQAGPSLPASQSPSRLARRAVRPDAGRGLASADPRVEWGGPLTADHSGSKFPLSRYCRPCWQVSWTASDW
jgi:hypothetical protein